MSIGGAQAALLEEVRAAVRVPGLPAVRSVEPGPGEWSEAYFKRIVGLAPAVRLAFLRGEPRAPGATMLDLDTMWSVICVAPWSGASREAAADGSLVLAENVAARLHRCKPAGDAYGVVETTSVERIWSGDIDRQGRAVAAVGLVLQVSVDPAGLPDLEALSALEVDWDIPGGLPVDAEQRIELGG